MILAMNIGNTNFALGFKQGANIEVERYTIKLFEKQVDFVEIIGRAIDDRGISKESIAGAIFSSVNPKLTICLEKAVKELFSIKAIVVNAKLNMKLDLSCYDASQIGNDRITECEAAILKYHLPLIVFDFGTATTINVIDTKGRFLGGSILAGLMMGVGALVKDTAQLPRCEFNSRTRLIGSNAKECIESGAVFGNASMLEGMVGRIEKQLGQKVTIVLTGGNSDYILPACNIPVIHEPSLLFEGLYTLYESNKL